jgi:hypothetical protein
MMQAGQLIFSQGNPVCCSNQSHEASLIPGRGLLSRLFLRHEKVSSPVAVAAAHVRNGLDEVGQPFDSINYWKWNRVCIHQPALCNSAAPSDLWAGQQSPVLPVLSHALGGLGPTGG